MYIVGNYNNRSEQLYPQNLKLEWKNPIDFGENRKTKMADGGHFVKIC